MTDQPKPKALRGFAALKAKDPERFLAITRQGGASVKPENRSFFRDHDLAAAAGSKGGLVSQGGRGKR